jgi:hypothetical protein
MKLSLVLWLCCGFLFVAGLPITVATGYASAGLFTWFIGALSGYFASACEYYGI